MNVLLMLQPLTSHFISIMSKTTNTRTTIFYWNLKWLCFNSVITSGSLKNTYIVLGLSIIVNKASDTKNVKMHFAAFLMFSEKSKRFQLKCGIYQIVFFCLIYDNIIHKTDIKWIIIDFPWYILGLSKCIKMQIIFS